MEGKKLAKRGSIFENLIEKYGKVKAYE